MIFSKKSTLRIFMVFFLPAIVFLGCDSRKPVKIGFIACLTGHMADSGIPSRNAVQLAVEQINETGGIHGRRVSLIIKDDRLDADTAVRDVQELIANDVSAVIGPTASTVAMAISPYLNKARLVAVGSSVTTSDLSGLDDYFFRVCMSAVDFARHSADYQIRSGDMRRIAVAHEVSNRSFSESWLSIFKDRFIAGGGDILTTIEFSTKDDNSFYDISRSLLASGPDGVMIIASPNNSALLCQHIRKINPSVKITLSTWGASRRFIELGGRAAEGVTAPSSFDWDSPSPQYQSFRRVYIERYQNDPGPFGFFAYDAVRVVLTAMKAQEKEQHLKETLLSVGEFDGLQHKIRFDKCGDVESFPVTMRIVRNHKFVVIE